MAAETELNDSSPGITENHAVEHAFDLASRIGDLFLDDKTADMMLVVEGEYLAAHRAILSTSCEYFRALLYGNLKESLLDEVVLEDVPLRGFKLVMSYIYTGQLRAGEVDEDTLLEVLFIAHMYGITKLETSLSEHIQKNLSLKNVCMIYNKAHFLKLEDLDEACYLFMIQEPNAILKTESFCDLSEAALCEVLSWETFNADEIGIFEAVLRWHAKHQSEQDLGNVLKQIRLPLIDTKDLLTTVKDSGLIPIEVLVDAIKANECQAADRNFRGSLRKDVNLATSDWGSVMLKAKIRGKYVAARSCLEYDSEETPPFTSVLSFPPATGFTVALSEAFFINQIRFKICDRSVRCSYYVEVSVNLVDWARVIDHSRYDCSLFQNLHFKSRVVRYVRLIGTQTNRTDKLIAISELEVKHSTVPFELNKGFYAPEKNVSSSAQGAIVMNSLNNSEALINDKITENPEWTSHEIGNGFILIKLPQPYTVNSMRMLLRSDESRAYLYYVDTSVDCKTWTRVADHTTNLCRSWQSITFEAQPVLYINIVGTASTVDKVFSCSRFECPAPPKDLSGTDDCGSGEDAANGD